MQVICKSCGVTFDSNYSKTLGFCHNCIHNNKIYVCTICGKEFKSKPKTVFIKGTTTCKQCVIKQVCLERYGVTNPMKDKNIAHQSVIQRMKCFDATQFKKKSIDTKIKHYGSIEDYIRASNKKRAETNLKKYGVAFPQQLEITKQKAAQTCLHIYGVTSPGQSTIIKEKIKQTCLEKYGVDNPFKNKEIQEKIKQTCLKKYGVENSRQAKVVQEKYNKIWAQKSSKELKRIRSKSVKKYMYKNQSFDSSWELAVWIWAIETGKQIKREPVSLGYEFEEKKHTYYPDFEINGQLVEVKGCHFFKEDGTMQNPFDHSKDTLFEIKHQCGLKNNVQFWSGKEMQPILDYMKLKYGKGWVSQFKK